MMNNYFNRIACQSIMPPQPRPIDLPSPVALARLRRQVVPQKEMARLVGVDPGQLSRFERGLGSMSYDRIRRYAHVLNLRLAVKEPHRFLVERITNRGPLYELRPTDPLDVALEAMIAHGIDQLPVRGHDGALRGVLTSVAVSEALADPDLEAALVRPVGQSPLEPLDIIRPGDSVQRVAALLASHWLVLVVDDAGHQIGFATRSDLFPLVLGQSPPQPRH